MTILYTEFTMSELLDTISQNPAVTKLRLYTKTITIINPDKLDEFIVEHPCMVELDWPSYQLTPEDATNVIGVMESLKMFQFLISGQADYDELVNQLEDEWKDWKHQLEIDLHGRHLVTLSR